MFNYQMVFFFFDLFSYYNKEVYWMKVLLMVVMATVLVSVSMGETSTMSLEDLKKQACIALNTANVTGKPTVDDVVAYVGRCVKKGKVDEAFKYLDKGLLLYPGQLDYQILYAKLLMTKGDDSLAKEKADLVYKYSETDDLINQASQILGKDMIADFPVISKLPGTDHCVVLVPMQGCDKWLVSGMTNELSSTLGIPVYIQTIDVEYPEANRSAYDQAIVQLRAKLNAQLSNPLAVMLMQKYGYTEKDFESDDKLIMITKKTMAMQNPAAAEKFIDKIEMLKSQENQWDAKILKAVLFNAVKSYSRDGVIYLAITPVDIYSASKKFVLGSADSFGGVVSYYRLASAFAKASPNQDRLSKRTKMQCLASLGDVVGLDSCSNSICARAYPKSLAAHDAKSGELCDKCRSALKKVFGQ
jgi:predicted Zn-dependent protease